MSNSRRSVTIDFEVEGAKSFGYEIDAKDNALLDAGPSDGVTLHLNSAGCMKLAQLLLKLGYGPYRAGFHVHLGKNFDPDMEEKLCLMLVQDNPQSE